MARNDTHRAPGTSRRTFCIGVGSTAVLMGLGALRYAGSTPLLRPPGGQDEDRLLARCIRCQRCYEVCPHHVIAPARLEDGFMGMRTPTLDFASDHCDSCAVENNGRPLCAAVCPTEALWLPDDSNAADVTSANADSAAGTPLALKSRTVVTPGANGAPETRTPVHVPDIGLAVVNERECLAFRGTGCRFCYDACPLDPKAIELRGDGGSEAIPRVYVLPENCNGCGACESVCVSLKAGTVAKGATERAIVVRPFELVEAAR